MNTDVKKAKLIIKENDYQTLSMLVKSIETETAERLEEELERASVFQDAEMPKDVVAMNSTVHYLDLETNKQSTITLVYPPDVDIEKARVSVLAPIGAALIGLRVGQEIAWPMPQGNVKRIKVVEVKNESL